MQLNVCAVFDRKLGINENPFTVLHVGQAIREFETLQKTKTTKYGTHPEDYSLVQVGTYDEETGKFENLKAHITLVAGKSNDNSI